MTRLALILATFALFPLGAAEACTPGFKSPLSFMKNDDACSRYGHGRGDYRSDYLRLSDAIDLGNGRTRQTLSMSACTSFKSVVTTDCASGRTSVIGTFVYAGSDMYNAETLTEEIAEDPLKFDPDTFFEQQERQIGPTATLEEMMKHASKYAFVNENIVVDTPRRHKFGGRTFDLTCACRLYYPDSRGANS